MARHPDLEALASRYNELFQATTEGHISAEDALAALAGLVVTDGTGAQWKINAYGKFTRAEYPGAPDVEVDEAQYVGPETVQSNPETGQYDVGPVQAPTSPTWAETPPEHAIAPDASPFDAGFGTPHQAPTQESPFGAEPAPFGQQPDAGFPTSDPSPFGGPPAGLDPNSGFGAPHSFEQAPGFGTPHHGHSPADTHPNDPSHGLHQPAGHAISRPFEEPKGRSLNDTDTKAALGAKVAGLGNLVKRNKVPVIIAVIALVFVYAFFARGGEEGQEVPTAGDASSQPADEQPAGDLPAEELPAEELPAEETQAPAPEVAALPNGTDVNLAVSALTAGDRTLIAKSVAQQSPAGDLAHTAAFYAGLSKADLAVVPGPVAKDPDADASGALQAWQIRSGDETVMTIKVLWVKDGPVWKLAALPVPTS